MKATVVGGGIVGLSCAYELAERNLDVTVLEAGSVGAGVSQGNAGWVTPFLSAPHARPGVVREGIRSVVGTAGPARMRPSLDLAFLSWCARFLRASRPTAHRRGVLAMQRLASAAVAAFDRLAERGVVFQEYRSGLALVARTDRGLRGCERLVEVMRGAGYGGEARVVRGVQVTEFDPALRHDLAGVVHLADERHVRPETVTGGLADELRRHGARLVESASVSMLGRRHGRWVTRTSDGSEFVSDHVVVAAGYGSRRLLSGLGVALPLQMVKGISLTARGSGTSPRHPLKLSEAMVACSPFDEVVRLSGGFDLGARMRDPEPHRLRAVVEQGLEYLHDWRPTEIEMAWSGQRPTSPDDLPIIGPIPGLDGLHVATGHGTLGVTLGPLTGRLVAAEITGAAPLHALDAFRPTRFRTGRTRRLDPATHGG